jgi:hypothetical protein
MVVIFIAIDPVELQPLREFRSEADFVPPLFRCDADEARQHESSGLFLAFHLLAFHKKLDKDFFVFFQQKKHGGEPTRAETTWLSSSRRSPFPEAPRGRYPRWHRSRRKPLRFQ